jgi:hypothetical protein
MLRTFAAGAIAAFVASRVMKMNEEGRLDGLKGRLQQNVDRLRGSNQGAAFAPQRRPLPAPAKASSTARISPSDEVSKPARAHPWPVDPRAMPE